MANVRLLRQRLSDYNAAIDKVNRTYQRDYDQYAEKVETWNAIAKATPYVTEVQGVGYVDGDTSTGNVAVLSDGRHVNVGNQSPQPGQYYNVVSEEEMVVNPATGRAEPQQVNRVSFTAHPVAAGPLPEEATMRKAPIEPKFTQNDLSALRNPPTDAAGVEMARAKGWTGQSELVAENEDRARISAFQSAFDNPDNPQALKDRGILAKTMAGKL